MHEDLGLSDFCINRLGRMGRLSGIWLDMATRSQNQGMLEDLCKERPLCLDGLA